MPSVAGDMPGQLDVITRAGASHTRQSSSALLSASPALAATGSGVSVIDKHKSSLSTAIAIHHHEVLLFADGAAEVLACSALGTREGVVHVSLQHTGVLAVT